MCILRHPSMKWQLKKKKKKRPRKRAKKANRVQSSHQFDPRTSSFILRPIHSAIVAQQILSWPSDRHFPILPSPDKLYIHSNEKVPGTRSMTAGSLAVTYRFRLSRPSAEFATAFCREPTGCSAYDAFLEGGNRWKSPFPTAVLVGAACPTENDNAEKRVVKNDCFPEICCEYAWKYSLKLR